MKEKDDVVPHLSEHMNRKRDRHLRDNGPVLHEDAAGFGDLDRDHRPQDLPGREVGQVFAELRTEYPRKDEADTDNHDAGVYGYHKARSSNAVSLPHTYQPAENHF